MLASHIHPIIGRHTPGLTLSVVIAAAATFAAEHQGGPALLYALLLGMALKGLADGPSAAPGIAIASRGVLRVGIALLGLKIAVDQVIGLGLGSATLIAAAVTTTICFGVWLARRLGLRLAQGLLTGGATAICGASAALAIGSLLPSSPENERDTTFAVVGVTTLSTAAMILYPPLLSAVGVDDGKAGFFIGATVHDVAQVVGAGYMISPEAGDIATVTKLFRVALLVPVTLVVAAVCGQQTAARTRVRIPWFLTLFLLLVGLNSMGLVPQTATTLAGTLSRWCLVTAIAAVGLKTSLADFRDVGPRPLVLLLAETAFLAMIVGAGILFGS